MHILIASVLGAVAVQASPTQPAATPPALAAAEMPVTVEYYYRLKWGSGDEFKELYERNHAPLLREMQKAGIIQRMEMEEPFTHLAGGERWDLRVTITYRNADDAMAGPRMSKAGEEAWGRLFKDGEKFVAEEKRRFSLVEEHWDVVVKPAG